VIGKFDKRQSWEKQSVYKLDNGWTATLEYSHYGEMVSRLDSPKGEIVSYKNAPQGKAYWHCSDGHTDLPDFARPWIKIVVPSAGTEIVCPGFEKDY
jgi:hypothetical protein